MKKNLFWGLVLTALVAACGNKQPSAAELQRKIDSVQAVETVKRLEMQGISLKERSPLQLFYDSLAIQVLPLRYSKDYVEMLPNYMPVPYSIKTFLDLEGRDAPKAIALPETLGAKLLLLAADVSDGEYELWLYSLDNECVPLDKLQLYEPSKFSEKKLKTTSQETFFSITSDYEISIMEYADEDDREGQLSTFVIDDSRQFVEKQALMR